MSEKAYTIQKYIVVGFTSIEFVGIMSLCIFALVTTSQPATILGIILEMILPGAIAMAVKIWVVFVKKYPEKKNMEREMKTGDLQDFYNYQKIENGSIN